jgi:hypothetical protein
MEVRRDGDGLIIEGAITNTSSESAEIPPLNVALRDASGKNIHSKQIAPPVPRLSGNATTQFTMRFDRAEDWATGVAVTFSVAAAPLTNADANQTASSVKESEKQAAKQPHGQLSSPEPLTATEMNLLIQQLYQCWNVPAGARDARNLVIAIRVTVGPDGVVRQATIVDQARLSDPIFRAVAESARRAFFNPQCNPLRVPEGKYRSWKELVIKFSPIDIL